MIPVVVTIAVFRDPPPYHYSRWLPVLRTISRPKCTSLHRQFAAHLDRGHWICRLPFSVIYARWRHKSPPTVYEPDSEDPPALKGKRAPPGTTSKPLIDDPNPAAQRKCQAPFTLRCGDVSKPPTPYPRTSEDLLTIHLMGGDHCDDPTRSITNGKAVATACALCDLHMT